MQERKSPYSDEPFRSRLAGRITSISLVLIFSISAVAIALSDDRAEASRMVFGSVLPLLGTWVGTVLAFYFARDNFEAAAASTLRAAGRISEKTVVTEVMIRRPDMLVRILEGVETLDSVTLFELTTLMTSKGYKRIPILNQSGAVMCVVHEALVLLYAKSQDMAATDPVFLARTVDDLRQSPSVRTLSDAIAFVSESATVGDARECMARVVDCNDVFVTPTGIGSESIFGWLPNSLLAEVE